MHGFGLSVRLRQMSQELFQVEMGSLYPALHSLEASGALDASWRESDRGPRRRYYKITKAGLGMLEEHATEWAVFSQGMARAVGGADR